MFLDLIAWDFRDVLQDYLTWIIGISAIIWGGGPERAAALTWLLVFELLGGTQDLFFDPGAPFQTRIDVFLASLDVLAAASWITIALYANRSYTLWIAGLQVVAVLAHIASAIAEPILPIAYAIMVIGPGWIQLLLLAIGLSWHLLRKRKFGAYRDWRMPKYTGDSAISGGYGNVFADFLSRDLSSRRDGLK